MLVTLRKMGRWCLRKGTTAYLDEKLVAQVQDADDHGGDLGEPYEGVHIVTWQWSRAGTDVDGNRITTDIAGETTNRVHAG